MTRITRLGSAVIASLFMFMLAGAGLAQDARGVAYEVVISKPKAGVSLDALLKADKEMEEQFVAKQEGFIDRKVGVSKDGEVFVVVRWKTLADAERAGAAFRTAPAAQARLKMSEASLFKHYVHQ